VYVGLYLDIYTVVFRVMYNCTLETHMKVRPIVFRGMYRAFFFRFLTNKLRSDAPVSFY